MPSSSPIPTIEVDNNPSPMLSPIEILNNPPPLLQQPTSTPTSSTNNVFPTSSNVPKKLKKEDIIYFRLKDVSVDKDNNVVSIGEHPIGKISLMLVRAFMSANDIKRKGQYLNKPLLNLIAQAKKEYDKSKEKLLPKSAATKPSFVTTDDTMERAIQVYFDQAIRSEMQLLGTSMNKDELDSRDLKNKNLKNY